MSRRPRWSHDRSSPIDFGDREELRVDACGRQQTSSLNQNHLFTGIGGVGQRFCGDLVTRKNVSSLDEINQPVRRRPAIRADDELFGEKPLEPRPSSGSDSSSMRTLNSSGKTWKTTRSGTVAYDSTSIAFSSMNTSIIIIGVRHARADDVRDPRNAAGNPTTTAVPAEGDHSSRRRLIILKS